jgi:hypothetical protein
LARASALHAEGHRFDSDILHQKGDGGKEEEKRKNQFFYYLMGVIQAIGRESLGSSPTHHQFVFLIEV